MISGLVLGLHSVDVRQHNKSPIFVSLLSEMEIGVVVWFHSITKPGHKSGSYLQSRENKRVNKSFAMAANCVDGAELSG